MSSIRHAALGPFLAVLAFISPCNAGEGAVPWTRPFYMGFTRWPADLSLEGFRTAQDFAHEHGDIVSVMFIGGVPWPEAYDGRAFSKDVDRNLSYRPPNGKELFLSISPLNKDRSDLAPYWGEKDNLPLPEPWDRRQLNSPEGAIVKCCVLAEPIRRRPAGSRR